MSYSLDAVCTSESGHVLSITIDLRGFSAAFVYSMITEWNTDIRCHPAYKCANKSYPFGGDGNWRAGRIYRSLKGVNERTLIS
ncbi:hypothetical protein N7463_001136 [Penicillium fimorum]|uniref:Uncharacterized protein n=1 Tax=Penicillium fimorum TaxID=1882269 RepID=A0A9W9Y6G5_9EURO|nr:hypothetical protein N7463_001136 [Penicillium fimorum]